MENLSKEEIADKILLWYKAEHCNQGDDYHVGLDKNEKWYVGHSNDYPMQHGKGKTITLSDEQFNEAINREMTLNEKMWKWWRFLDMEKRDSLCVKYGFELPSRCLSDDKKEHIYLNELTQTFV